MMKMEINSGLQPSRISGGLDSDDGGVGKKWELRPGGMLVQKRTDENDSRLPPPKIRVRVKYREVYHEIHITPEASFGELKKMLTGLTGLHHHDQKLYYKNKEKDSKAFLDTSGIKDKSKLTLLEDPISKEKRYLEMKKKSQIEKASNIISHVSLQIDKLAKQVSSMESVVTKGEKVVQNDLTKLTDSLMNQLLQLDEISIDFDDKLQQVKRVKNNVEKLDVLKLKNSSLLTRNELLQNKNKQQNKRVTFCCNSLDQEDKQELTPVMVTTKWETFDSTVAPLIDAPSASSSSCGASKVDPQLQPGFTWNLL